MKLIKSKKSKSSKSIEQIFTEKRDNSLVKATLAGDEKSFAKLVSLYKKRVEALGMSFFRNKSDTDDFVQEVFLKVFTSLKNFQMKSSFSTWLMSIAFNTAVNTKNRRKEFLPLSDSSQEMIQDKDFSPEKKEIRRITAAAVNEAVKNLPEIYALCIELYFYYDFPHAEISRITGLPVNTIKSHIFRAKKILKEKLKEFYDK